MHPGSVCVVGQPSATNHHHRELFISQARGGRCCAVQCRQAWHAGGGVLMSVLPQRQGQQRVRAAAARAWWGGWVGWYAAWRGMWHRPSEPSPSIRQNGSCACRGACAYELSNQQGNDAAAYVASAFSAECNPNAATTVRELNGNQRMVTILRVRPRVRGGNCGKEDGGSIGNGAC